jgi:PAS domain S-box-containing protein
MAESLPATMPIRVFEEHLPVVFFATDAQGVITHSEGPGLAGLGLKPGELVGKSVFETYPQLPNILTALRRALAGEYASCVETIANRILETRMAPSHNSDRQLNGVIGTSIDITAQVRQQQRTLATNRLYAVLSRIGEVAVQARSRQELFDAVCRTIVDEGAFQLAWIGAPHAESSLVQVLASAGDDLEYLSHLQISLTTTPPDRGPTTLALLEGRIAVCNDFAGDPRMRPWQAAAARHSFGSSASLPLLAHERVIAALSLYAGEPDFFDEQEVALLQRVIDVLALALDKLEEEQQRRRAEAARRFDIARQEALLRLSEMHGATEREIVDFALEEAVRLTGSQIGYLHFVNADQVNLQLFTWSQKVRTECNAPEPEHYPIEEAGIWMDSARRRQPVFHNDYPNMPHRKGLPEGHIAVQRHLSVPLIDHDKVVAVCGVGNKIEPYDETDARELLLFMSGMWSLLQRQRAETALRHSEARYRRLSEHAPDIIYRYRLQPEPAFDYVNPAVTALTGYTPEDHYADPQLGFKLVHPDDRALLRGLSDGSLQMKTPLELRWVRKDGGLLWVEQRNVPVFDDKGNLVAVEGIARDITERRQSEDAQRQRLEDLVAERTRELKYERDRTRAILDAMGEAVIVADMDGVIHYLNPAAVALTGFSLEEAPDMHYRWLWQHTDHGEALATIQTAVHAGKSWSSELVLRRADGTRYDAEMTVAPLFVPDVAQELMGLVSLQRDITANKAAMRLKDQFVSNVSHELRSPMGLITMLAGSLEMLYPRLDDEQRLEIICNIRSHARVLSDLISNVLEISRIDSNSSTPDQQVLDLAPLLAEEIAQQQPLALRRSLALKMHSEIVAPVLGHAGQLRQVIRNLLSNAIKYTPGGGTITGFCDVLPPGQRPPLDAAEPWPGVLRLPRTGWVVLRICDTGMGISEQDLPYIFDRFYRAHTESNIPGTGLGLSIAAELVKRHAGYLEVESGCGEGSCFAVYLPYLPLIEVRT